MESEESFESHLNSLKEMILDEEKIVTYVSLTKDLCIHVNNSKKLLDRIVKNITEQYPNIKINVNYIISGMTDENKARTTVCNTDDLPNIKKSFKIMFYEHIYSVSKGSPQTDHAAYLMLNKFDDYNLCTGLIKHVECSKHTSDQIGILKTNSQQAKSKDSIIPQKKIKTEPKIVSNLVKSNDVGEKTKTDVSEKLKSEIKSEMEPSGKESINNNKQNNKSNNKQKSQKGIAGFFNNSNGSQKKPLKNSPEQQSKLNSTDNIKIKEEKMEIDNAGPEPDSQKDEPSNKKNKVLNQIKKTSKIDKNRKRVLHVSDSDDEENDPFADKQDQKEIKNESDDEIPPTPSVNNIKITSGIVNPKKRRKVVDKTYTDEDGYILTKKEEVYESCSENEGDVKVEQKIKEVKIEKTEISPKDKKKGAMLNKKKISPPQKGKQTTLANFFTKK